MKFSLRFKKISPSVFLFVFLIAVAGSASSENIDLFYVDGATAVDNGPQDGIFDAFAPANLGSINNNGFTSFRTALEFDLSIIPSGSVINSATLTVQAGVYDAGVRNIELHSYIGSGSVQLEDFALNSLVGVRALSPTGEQIVIFNITPVIINHVANGQYVSGFNLREEPANTENYVVMNIRMGSTEGGPTLSIDYSNAPSIEGAPASIPVMNSTGIAVTILALLGLAIRHMRKKK
jgi:hypothetical protein